MTGRYINDVLVFCGARPGKNPLYMQEADRLGALLARDRYHVIYGGSDQGLMGQSARSALAGGSQVCAVFPKAFAHASTRFATNTPHIEVETLFQRKEQMLFRAQAAIVLPGGLGTLDELFEIAAANDAQRLLEPQKPVRPIILMNVAGYYDLQLKQLQHAVNEEFIHARTLDMFAVVNNADEAVAELSRQNALGPRPSSTLTP